MQPPSNQPETSTSRSTSDESGSTKEQLDSSVAANSPEEAGASTNQDDSEGASNNLQKPNQNKIWWEFLRPCLKKPSNEKCECISAIASVIAAFAAVITVVKLSENLNNLSTKVKNFSEGAVRLEKTKVSKSDLIQGLNCFIDYLEPSQYEVEKDLPKVPTETSGEPNKILENGNSS